MRQRKLYEIHLPDLKWSIRQFKMSESSTNRLPWVVLQINGTSEVGTFGGLINVFSPILIHKGYHFVSRPMVYCVYNGEDWEF